ncbi:GNAT family N-acetyltransferase [Arthrobacter sp. zg-Y895]|uniref:GNAT family N-acetyltransferase n=1 Tax=Arthrobacter sp. zg-Y895 TaxID=2886933 RepID=UPI002F3F521A
MRISSPFVPANQASCADLDAVFGARGEPHRCQCQWFKTSADQWRSIPLEERARRLEEQTGCGDPDSPTTGLVAYLGEEPVGWCAVEPRTGYPRLLRSRVPWTGREENRADAGVWSVSCFVTRTGYRRRGVSYALAAAAVDFARERGASALEGYPMITEPGRTVTWDELFVGSRSVFAAAGFEQVSHPTPRRVVMRIDFQPAPPSSG